MIGRELWNHFLGIRFLGDGCRGPLRPFFVHPHNDLVEDILHVQASHRRYPAEVRQHVVEGATDPNLELQGTVKEIDLSTEVHEEEGSTVLIKVTIDKAQLPHLRRGVTVTAKVYCGRRPLGYVWFHDLLAFIQSRILFRYF